MRFVSRSQVRMLAIVAGSMVAGGLMTVTALGGQPHMVNALRSLNNASAQLNMALPDKAGHRENALGLVSQAITQVQEGIAAGS